jgi:hypothetical protein
LASHPRIRTGQESKLFTSHAGKELRSYNHDLRSIQRGEVATGLPTYLTKDQFTALLKEYLRNLLFEMLPGLQPGDLFLEKTPDHSFYIPEILELLPKTRFIHILRDARDVVSSLNRSSKGWGTSWAPSSTGSATQMWVRHVEAVRKAAKNLPPGQFIEVRYEELMRSTAEEVRRIMKFLNLNWDETNLVSAITRNRPDIVRQTGNTVIPLGGEAAKINGPNFKLPQGFIGPVTPGTWKKNASLPSKFIIWYFARKTMKEVGYEWRYPW